MPRLVVIALLLILLLTLPAVALAVHYRLDRALRAATGTVADGLCAETFVSGFDPAKVFASIRERPSLRRVRWLLRYRVDRDAGSAQGSIMGLLASTARYRDGLGCVLLRGEEEPYLPRRDIDALRQAGEPSLLPDIAGERVVEPDSPELKAALDHAFRERDAPPLRRTRAVVIVHRDRIIAERYASGIAVDTQLMGYSLSKSLTNALLGVMTQQGLLSPSIPAPVAEWRRPDDPRREIEIEHLMRMTTGLALGEFRSWREARDQMELHRDMAAYAIAAPLIAPVGSRHEYSTATTQILARIIQQAAGGPEQVLAYAWRELFSPLGMRHVTLQFDASGTVQGGSNMLASARDWARLGLLYLHDGVVGGRRLLHEDWVDFCAAATLDTDYAAGFFTNRSSHPDAKSRVRGGMPADAYMAVGMNGQRIAILPSQDMVVVRLADTVQPDGDADGFTQLVREVIAAAAR